MAETPASVPTPNPEAPKQEAPTMICEKCRNTFPLDQFDHHVAGQECVCRRCLAVMGYRVK